jgi:hypothetical protein
MKNNNGWIYFSVLLLLAVAGGFGAGYSVKPETVYLTEYITQTQTQEQWQAQVNVTAIGGQELRAVNVALLGATNIIVKTWTNYELTNSFSCDIIRKKEVTNGTDKN